MSLKEKLNQVAHWTAALTAVATLHAGAVEQNPDNVNRNAPLESITRPTKAYLDYRVKRGALVNGQTAEERREKWQALRAEKGIEETLKAIDKEGISELRIPKKDEKGYVFETYQPGKKHVFESYYPNGVQQAKSGERGEEAEGYYPDGSRKFSRTADGIETVYHPGGAKGKEKIKETPHGLYDSYDVLDEQGRRIEHHYDVQATIKTVGEATYSSKDVKKVDLYNPDTRKLEATYTLDHWSVDEGRLAQIGIADETGQMKTMDFPKSRQIGDSDYYMSSLDTDMIKKIYQEETQDRQQKVLDQQRLNKFKAER